ncbi:metallophosphoesterase family protein [Rhodococcus qingshengii]|uniref:metallophosphoesterase family protein n=1 Tax=Rhodococcus qingshengii TaxID=334542 RepID=UPI0021B128EA|nr:metallophosphoesterase [Rhodococcus qingshengii]MCT6736592.1 metallophosphoesterase [Rhodococcus qingshengii]
MRTMILADRDAGVDLLATIAENDVECVITCGDLYAYHIRDLAAVTIPKFGVYGNHCDRGYFDELGITDLHRRRGTLPNGMSVVGLEGCVRYKNEPDVLYTQEEYAAMLSSYPWKIDVVVTHAPPEGVNDESDPAHVGITALRKYVDVVGPQYLLHGHTYPDPPLEQVGRTSIIYTHGMRIVTL